MTKKQTDELISCIRCLSDTISNTSHPRDSEVSNNNSHHLRSKYRKFISRPVRPSQVVPNEAYTIRELFERAVVNSMPEGLGRSYYAEESSDPSVLLDQEVVDFSRMDLVEIQEYRENLNSRITSHQQKLKDLQLQQQQLQQQQQQQQ